MDIAPSVTRVLVVDDDPDINRLVRVRLTARGFTVESAGNGEQALERLESFPADLAFLDVSMPGMGGLEVLENVRGRGLDMAVIMMTAFGSENVAIEALRRGADDYLRKPFEAKEFQAILDRTVSRLELKRQNAALRRQLQKELARAAQVQAALLPEVSPQLVGFEIAGRCLPARDVGGDFYDWLQAGDAVTLTIGDVMGKGMPAALLMATVRAAIRAVASSNGPAAAINLVANALAPDLDRAGAFVTLCHVRLDMPSRRLRFVDAGHGHVFLRRSNGAVEHLEPGGLPMGVPWGQDYEEGETTIDPGDTLVLYSDGVVDSRPELAVDANKIAAELAAASGAAEMVDRIVEMTKAVDVAPDDLTVVVLHAKKD